MHRSPHVTYSLFSIFIFFFNQGVVETPTFESTCTHNTTHNCTRTRRGTHVYGVCARVCVRMYVFMYVCGCAYAFVGVCTKEGREEKRKGESEKERKNGF